MDEMKKVLAALTKEFPTLEQAKFYASLDSTNLEAKRIAEQENPSSALLVSDTQTAGRGRMGRHWESPKGKGLYFSLLLHPRLKPAQATLITLAAGWSLGMVLREMGVSPLLIKWPNDLILQEKKIAGILCEMKSMGEKVEYVVVGIGINLSQTSQDFSPEVAERAGSLGSLTGEEWGSEKKFQILKNFLQVFFPEIKKLEKSQTADLIQRWEMDSGQLGRRIRAVSNENQWEGTVLGLNPQGHLRIKLEDGTVQNLIDEETTLL